MNSDPISVEIQEPLRVEIVDDSGPSAPIVSRTTLRDANGVLVATMPGEFDPSSIHNIAVIQIGRDEVAVYATQSELRGIVGIAPARRYETEDCSGEEAAGFFRSPSGFYQEGSIAGDILTYWDSENISPFEARSFSDSRARSSCEAHFRFISWTAPDFCCLSRLETFESGPVREFSLGHFTPPFRVVRETSP